MRAGFNLRDRDDGSAAEVEGRVLVRGVFDQHVPRGADGKLVVVTLDPVGVGVDELRSCRDDLAQVEPDLRQQAVVVERRREGLTLRQRQQGLPPRPPA